MDPRLRTLAMRAALLADDDRQAADAYAVSVAAFLGLNWGRLDRADRARVGELAAQCGRLSDGGWDFSRLRRAEVDELEGLAWKAAGLDRRQAA